MKKSSRFSLLAPFSHKEPQQKGKCSMPILNKFSGAFPTALIYITVGTLIVIWTIVSMVFNAPATHTGYFWVMGFLLTGLALLAIGLLLGQIGRAVRTEKLPPPVVTATAVQTEQNAAGMAVVVPVSPAVPVMAPTTPVPGGVPVAGIALAGAPVLRT
jgi:hypothetical protein